MKKQNFNNQDNVRRESPLFLHEHTVFSISKLPSSLRKEGLLSSLIPSILKGLPFKAQSNDSTAFRILTRLSRNDRKEWLYLFLVFYVLTTGKTVIKTTGKALYDILNSEFMGMWGDYRNFMYILQSTADKYHFRIVRKGRSGILIVFDPWRTPSRKKVSKRMQRIIDKYSAYTRIEDEEEQKNLKVLGSAYNKENILLSKLYISRYIAKAPKEDRKDPINRFLAKLKGLLPQKQLQFFFRSKTHRTALEVLLNKFGEEKLLAIFKRLARDRLLGLVSIKIDPYVILQRLKFVIARYVPEMYHVLRDKAKSMLKSRWRENNTVKGENYANSEEPLPIYYRPFNPEAIQ